MDELDMKIKEACEKISDQLIGELEAGENDVMLSERFYQKMKEEFTFVNDKNTNLK